MIQNTAVIHDYKRNIAITTMEVLKCVDRMLVLLGSYADGAIFLPDLCTRMKADGFTHACFTDKQRIESENDGNALGMAYKPSGDVFYVYSLVDREEDNKVVPVWYEWAKENEADADALDIPRYDLKGILFIKQNDMHCRFATQTVVDFGYRTERHSTPDWIRVQSARFGGVRVDNASGRWEYWYVPTRAIWEKDCIDYGKTKFYTNAGRPWTYNPEPTAD